MLLLVSEAFIRKCNMIIGYSKMLPIVMTNRSFCGITFISLPVVGVFTNNHLDRAISKGARAASSRQRRLQEMGLRLVKLVRKHLPVFGLFFEK